MAAKGTRRNSNFKFIAVFVAIAFVITAAAVITGGYSRSSYHLAAGTVSPVKFTATRDVEKKVLLERRREEARKSVMDIYIVDTETNDRLFTQMNSFFDQVGELRNEKTPIFTPYANQEKMSEDKLLAYITQNQVNELLGLPDLEYARMKADLTTTLQTTLEQGVRPDGEEKALADTKEQLANLNYNQTERNLAYEIVSNFIEPNLVVDYEATELRREEKAAQIAPEYYLKNEKIVDTGEVITEEMYAALEELGFVSKNYIETFLSSLGALIIVATVFTFTLMYMSHFPQMLAEKRKTVILAFTLYALIVSITWTMIGANQLFVPILLFTMLWSMLLGYRLSIMMNFSVVVITTLVLKADLDYMLYYLVTGTAIAILARYTTERSKVLLVGLVSGAVNVFVLLGYTIFFDTAYTGQLIQNMFYALISGVATVILCTGSLPLWEAAFGVITPIKLLDLTNPSNKILHRLTLEAPGTYHHSLIVANLAETAAFDIGANATLVRVGGYYHDIGKLKYPQYFAENQVGGENPHSFIDAVASASIIRSHVDFGIEMACNEKLPIVIKDMIAQHHGSTLIKYFYYKYKSENPDKEIDESEFRYPYEPPTTRESAILMLADTVEAAVRSMVPTGKTMPEVEVFINTLIKDKLDDGQLTESGLTIKDLATVTGSFMRVFRGMYHERIPYPTDSKKQKKLLVDETEKRR
ncbi:HD family phosphohydrolase [Clostridia bacterium]|nr:HD family phosphohydrolase [Clostridia bacterium]